MSEEPRDGLFLAHNRYAASLIAERILELVGYFVTRGGREYG